MTDKAVILANYTHAEFKPGLKVCRIVLEIPQEKRKEFFDAFGYPDPANPVPVALARLAGGSAPSAPERAAEGPTASIPQVPQEGLRGTVPFRARKRAAQAAILLDQEAFQRWVLPEGSRSPQEESLKDWAEREFKKRLGIESKTELDLKPETCGKAFDLLRDTYEVETRWGRT